MRAFACSLPKFLVSLNCRKGECISIYVLLLGYNNQLLADLAAPRQLKSPNRDRSAV